MAKQSKADRLLAEREAHLDMEVRRIGGELERCAGELRALKDIRRQLAALPKRSRAKTEPATAPASTAGAA